MDRGAWTGGGMMSSAENVPYVGPGQFAIFLDVEGAPAGPIGEILDALSDAFRSGRRLAETDLSPDFDLRIVETGVGTWWAILETFSLVKEINDEVPGLIPMLGNDLLTTIRILRSEGPEDIPRHLAKLVRDLMHSAKKARAKGLDIIGSARIHINAMEFAELGRRAARALRSPPQATRAEPADMRPIPAVEKAITKAGNLAGRSSLFATIFQVDDTWYARAEGMHGVMVPIELSAGNPTTPQHGHAYQIKGAIIRSHEGFPVGLSVIGLQPIPSGGRA